MNPQLLPSQLRDDVPAWAQTVVAFLAEKERRSGSRRTVEGYARMLWPFFDRVGSPDRVTPAHVLAWAHGIGASGREPSSATVGARIASAGGIEERGAELRRGGGDAHRDGGRIFRLPVNEVSRRLDDCLRER